MQELHSTINRPSSTSPQSLCVLWIPWSLTGRMSSQETIHKIQVLSLTWNIYVVIVYVFFCIKWTIQRLWTSFTALTLSLHQKLDASKSISYTTVGPSAQTVQANSRQPLVGTGKNVKQPVTDHSFMTIHRSLHSCVSGTKSWTIKLFFEEWLRSGRNLGQKACTYAYVLPDCILYFKVNYTSPS